MHCEIDPAMKRYAELEDNENILKSLLPNYYFKLRFI